MPYRQTENVVRKLAARHEAILAAACDAASAGGMAAVQIAPVAERAGIAAGTVYRYFPSKTELVAALVAELAAREIGALARAAAAAPGPLGELERLIRVALEGGHLPDQDAALAAPALLGALIEGLIGPLAPVADNDPAKARARVQALTLFALRGLGVVDARARGLVVQTAMPEPGLAP